MIPYQDGIWTWSLSEVTQQNFIYSWTLVLITTMNNIINLPQSRILLYVAQYLGSTESTTIVYKTYSNGKSLNLL